MAIPNTVRPPGMIPGLMALTCSLLLLGACGGNEGESGPRPSPGPVQGEDTDVEPRDVDQGPEPDTSSDTASVDMGVQDAGVSDDADAGDAGNPCEEGCGLQEFCNEDGQCEDLAQMKCEAAAGKGELAPQETVTITGEFDGESGTNGLSTSCAVTDQTPEKVYKFTASEDSLIRMNSDWGGNLDPKVEFRRGADNCTDAPERLTTCRDDDTPVWVAGGETVTVIIENDTEGSGQFSLDLSAEAMACNPQTYSCTAESDLQYCQWDPESETASPLEFGCPDTCRSGECTGTSCETAIEVTDSGGTYPGDLEAFQSQVNFNSSGEDTCNVGDGNSVTNPETGGPEVIFSVEMQADETLNITTDDPADKPDNVIFIAENCSMDPENVVCLAATDDDTTSWTAPNDGTYYVYVETWATGEDSEFEYDFQIE